MIESICSERESSNALFINRILRIKPGLLTGLKMGLFVIIEGSSSDCFLDK